MKRYIPLFILFVASICGCQTAATGQSFWYAHYPPYGIFHLGRPGECIATREGRDMMVAGGASAVIGSGLLIIGNDIAQHSTNQNAAFAPTVTGAALFVCGTFWAVVGAAAFVGGKLHDAHHSRHRYSIIGSKNQFGLAYNF